MKKNKICSYCHIKKSIIYFSKDSSRKDELDYNCKSCNKIEAKKQKDKCKCGNDKDKRAKHCLKCYLKYNNPMHNEIIKKIRKFIHPLKEYYCKCGKKISYYSANYGRGRCISCSKKGKNSFLYINGEGNKIYPIDFSYKLKKQIRKRDNYTCQNCGIIENKYKIKWNKILEIHHIDHNRKNNKEENLITLCHKCNTKANFNIKYWIKFYRKIIKRISHG